MSKFDGNNESIFYSFILNITMKYIMEIIQIKLQESQRTTFIIIHHAKNVNVTSTIYAIHNLNNKVSLQMVLHASRTPLIVLHDSKGDCISTFNLKIIKNESLCMYDSPPSP